jgi:hypothetical protein
LLFLKGFNRGSIGRRSGSGSSSSSSIGAPTYNTVYFSMQRLSLLRI